MRFYVIGIDDSATPYFSDEVKAIISRAKIFSGGVRHRQIVEKILPTGSEWIDITPPMDALFERYRAYEQVVVFASGDPLFYGFAQTIQRLMPEAEIETFPYFNSLQQLAHALTMPYQNMHVVSLTGREWHKFDEALISGEQMIGVLTDTKAHTPRMIAARMLEYGYTNYTISIGELLGNKDQQHVETLSVEEVASRDFRSPNNMILNRIYPRCKHFGIPDSEFMLLDGRDKMITKMAIRLSTLSQLDLHNRKSMWDIGFCTGSVSIEAKLQAPHLKINAFEIREGCEKIIEANMRRFGAVGIDYHIGDFCLEDLDHLPNPDAVFIGGHGGKISEIVRIVSQRLISGGVLVFNSVSEQSCNDFISAVEGCSMEVTNHMKITVDNFNTITIIKAVKKEEV